MIRTVRPDQAARILKEQTYDTPDDAVVKRMWIKNLAIFGVVTLGALALFLYRYFTVREQAWRSAYILLGVVALDIIVGSKFVKSRIIGPRKFKAAIERFGKAELLSQITADDTEAFFFDETGENTDNIAVLTRDYFIVSRENVFAISEIRSAFFQHRYTRESSLSEFNDEYNRMVLSNVYTIDMTLPSGVHRKEFVAVPKEDIGYFIRALNKRAGEDKFRLMG